VENVDVLAFAEYKRVTDEDILRVIWRWCFGMNRTIEDETEARDTVRSIVKEYRYYLYGITKKNTNDSW
jgi:hypothetical protein